jgi:hypothetical protein
VKPAGIDPATSCEPSRREEFGIALVLMGECDGLAGEPAATSAAPSLGLERPDRTSFCSAL